MKRVGLFIGINKYENGISPLRCAVDDAYALSLAFNRDGFEVAFLSNDEGHCDNIRKKIKKMLSGLSSDDIFVFYFAGHGRDVKGSHYLVGPTAESDPELYSCGSLEFSVIRSLTDNIPGLNRLFILDCCRTSIFATRADDYVCENTRNIALVQAISSYNNQSESRPALVLCSCAPGQKAYENQTHGYFTEALLRSLEDKTINSFSQFAESIKIDGTPGAQNIDWQGNICDWKNVQLFERWNSQSGQISQKIDPVKYELPHLKADIKKISSDLSNELSDDVKKKLAMAEAAEQEQDYFNSKYFLEQAKQLLIDAVNKQKKVQKILIPDEQKNQPAVMEPVPKTEGKLTDVVNEQKKQPTVIESAPKTEGKLNKKSPAVKKTKQTTVKEDYWANAIALGVKFSNNKKTLLKCPVDVVELFIPEGVTRIEDNAFEKCEKLKKVTIPSSVTSIGDWAFLWCSKLTEITIPINVKTIGDWAFSWCVGLEYINILNENTVIGENVFSGCKKLKNRAKYEAHDLPPVPTVVRRSLGITAESDVPEKEENSIVSIIKNFFGKK